MLACAATPRVCPIRPPCADAAPGIAVPDHCVQRRHSFLTHAVSASASASAEPQAHEDVKSVDLTDLEETENDDGR